MSLVARMSSVSLVLVLFIFKINNNAMFIPYYILAIVNSNLYPQSCSICSKRGSTNSCWLYIIFCNCCDCNRVDFQHCMLLMHVCIVYNCGVLLFDLFHYALLLHISGILRNQLFNRLLLLFFKRLLLFNNKWSHRLLK